MGAGLVTVDSWSTALLFVRLSPSWTPIFSLLSFFFPLVASSPFEELPLRLQPLHRMELRRHLRPALSEVHLHHLDVPVLHVGNQMLRQEVCAVQRPVDLDQWNQLLGNLLL